MTSVRPVNRDHTVISLSPGYTAVTFRLSNGGYECVILDPTDTECTRLGVAPPEEGQTLSVISSPDRVDIYYRKKQ